jgi:hypothetical protein
METDKCPKCGAGERSRNSIFVYFTCGSHQGETFHQSDYCRRMGKGTKTTLDGLTACCNAELDQSRVITSGRHAGHGPRMCSKCGKVVFIV